MNSEIKYYRINSNNTAIATSNSGVGTTSPTEELTTPTAAGTYSTASGTTVTNQTASFGALSAGQYLYYIDGSTGEYILMGQIASISSPTPTTVTLTANYTGSPVAGDTLAGSYSLITTTEPIYIRVKTEASGSTALVIPDFSKWRSSADRENGLNNEEITALEQISSVGSPISPLVSTISIQFTIRTMNNFTFGTVTNSQRAWPTTQAFPQYMWIRVTPSTSSATLASKTMYRWTTQDSFDGQVVGAGSSGPTVTQLQGWGYNTNGSTTSSNNSGNV